jgi:hypothetical protein
LKTPRQKRQSVNVSVFRLGVVVLLFGSACTLVNSFDEVKPLSDGTYAPSTGGPSGEGGSNSDAPVTDAPFPSNAGGAIVVAGQVASDAGAGLPTSVLAVLDPVTGRQIGERENMVVASVRYDGLRDLWYVFESKTPEWAPGPTAEVIFHVRSLDLTTGKWTERGSIPVPPLQHYESIGVVRERVAYVAHSTADAGAVQLVTIDTTDPAKPTLIDQQLLDRTPLGAVATRSGTGPGGVVGLVRLNTSACVGNVCNVELVRVRIPNGTLPQIDSPATLGTASRNSSPSFATFSLVERDVIVFPRPANDASTTASMFEPRTQVPQGLPSSFYVTDSLLRRTAVSECTQTAFVVGANGDLDLHAVPVFGDGGGTASAVTTGHSGQSVYFEPTTRTVLAPFGQGAGFVLSAFRLAGTSDAPQLTRRTTADWNPPTDLRPILLAIRVPVPIVCP